MGYSDFLSLKGIIVGVVLIIASGLFWVAWHFWIGSWWKRAEKKLEVPDTLLEEATKKVEAAPVASPSGYICKCGKPFLVLKDMRIHMLKDGRGHKGMHGIASKPEVKVAEVSKVIYPEISETGKYHAYIWEPNPGIVIANITQPVGKIWMADTTLPKSGACYFCRRDAQGHLIAYDPRLAKYDPQNSPERLYRATNAADVVNPVYTAQSTGWEKFNVLAPYIIAALLALAAIVKAGS